MKREREMSTKQKQKKKTVIISIICLLIVVFLVLGIRFYKSYLRENQAPQQEEVVVDTKKDSKPRNKPKPVDITSEDTSEVALDELVVSKDETILDSTESETETPNIKEEANELEDIYINHTRSLLGKNGILPDNLPTGKVYYQGNKGNLESLVKRDGDKISEQLISYDKQGNKVDELEIGIIEESDKAVKHAVISKNKISVFEIMPAKDGKKTEERVTEYTITPSMKFRKGKTYVRLL
jgi:flagellar basal body-associated protein FliL